MKFAELPESLKHICVHFIEQSDVSLRIPRTDLAILLSELMENLNEGEDDICSLPLKLNVDKSKGIPNNKRVYFTIDEQNR